MTALRRLAAAGAGLSAAAAVLFTAPAANAAGVTYTTTTDPAHAAAGWLATQFVDSRHLPAPAGDHFDSKFGGAYYPSYGENADAIFGLAAAKAASSKIDVALGYLKKHVDDYADISGTQGGPYDGDVAKLVLTAEVAGVNPTFGKYNLLAQLAKDECTATSSSCAAVGAAANIYASVSESFTILAEARAGGSHAPTAHALDYFTSLQCADGGFTDKTTACGSGAADVDSTSYAIMALSAVGGQQTRLTDAVNWLRGQQKAKGYWEAQGIPNANSTGLAAAALSGQGVGVASARDWLRSQQVAKGSAGAGAIKYNGTLTPTTTSATSPSVLATAQALTGLVDGGSLATLTANGASNAVPMYPPHARLSARTAKAGARQSVTADGFVPGEKVHVVVHSAPVTVATATASALGAVSAKYTLPAGLAAGAHSIVLTGASSGLTVSEPLTVSAAPSTSNSSSSSTTGTGTTSTTPAATQPLAATGQNRRQLDELAVFGGLAVLIGSGLLLAGRRTPLLHGVRAAVGRRRPRR